MSNQQIQEPSDRLKECLLNNDNGDSSSNNTTLLIGADASGANSVLNVLRWRRLHAPETSVKVYLTTRDLEVFRTVQKTVEPFCTENAGDNLRILVAHTHKHIVDSKKAKEQPQQRAQPSASKRGLFDLVHNYQNNDNDDAETEYETDDETEEVDDSYGANTARNKIPNLSVQYCHFDFHQEIETGSAVFCQGNKALGKHVKSICKKNDATPCGHLQDTLVNSLHRYSPSRVLRKKISA